MKYSVIIPLKDERENIEPLIREVADVMEPLGSWELLCIDDGSQDGSWQLLEQLAKSHAFLRPIALERNYGQSSALDAGFRRAQGDVVITLDGDGQNDPKDIPKLLAKLEEGYDLVCGWRVTRRDPFSKRLISRVSNTVRRRLCEDGVHDTGCSLKVYRAPCLRHIKMYNGMHRFLPALFLLEGFKVTELPVAHRERLRGRSKYNLFNRAIRPLIDTLGVWWLRRRRLVYSIKYE